MTVLVVCKPRGPLSVPTTNHDMTKNHYISFIAFVRGDSAIISKQYPEWNMEFRLRKRGRGRLYYYCIS